MGRLSSSGVVQKRIADSIPSARLAAKHYFARQWLFFASCAFVEAML
jgi:hypothetical protein